MTFPTTRSGTSLGRMGCVHHQSPLSSVTQSCNFATSCFTVHCIVQFPPCDKKRIFSVALMLVLTYLERSENFQSEVQCPQISLPFSYPRGSKGIFSESFPGVPVASPPGLNDVKQASRRSYCWAIPPVRLGLSGRNSGKTPERPRKRSQSVSWNSRREYGWDAPNPIIQGI